MLDSYGAMDIIYILNGKSKGFGNTTPKVEEQPYQEPVSQVPCCVLKLLYFIKFQINRLSFANNVKDGPPTGGF